MTTQLQIGDRTVTAENVIPLLANYQLIPQLLCESIIDQNIESIECTDEETADGCQELYQHWQLDSEDKRQSWRSHYGLNQGQLERLATRRLRIEKFKQETWGHKLESYFLKRKNHLDRVIYSLIKSQDRGLANELYFRIQEKEQTFAELAYAYSQGAEAQTGGLLGPVEFGNLPFDLANLLFTSRVGEVQPPVPIGEWEVIVRVEQVIPAQLDDAMRQRLLNECFEAWLQEQLHALPRFDRIWVGISPNDGNSEVSR